LYIDFQSFPFYYHNFFSFRLQELFIPPSLSSFNDSDTFINIDQVGTKEVKYQLTISIIDIFDIFLNIDCVYGLLSMDRSLENFVFDDYDLSLFFFSSPTLFSSSYLYDTPALKQDDVGVVVVVVVAVKEAKDDEKKSYEITIDE
jgi:hypothetical protein